MNVELMPCPFCGGKCEITMTRTYRGDEETKFYGVMCSDCRASVDAIYLKEEKAAEKWNRRFSKKTDASPCPFCGKIPTVSFDTVTTDNGGLESYWRVSCYSCSMDTRRRAYRTADEAIAAWNRRTNNEA